MRLLHLSDLHLGKRIHECSLLEDQRHMLAQVLALCDEKGPDALLLSGDIYDRQVPSGEAVDLFDGFLTALAARGLTTFVISGNHDSAERLRYGGRIFARSAIHVAATPLPALAPVVLSDAHGPVHVYLMPFLRPAEVRGFFPAREIASYQDAVEAVLQNTPLDPAARNVLLAHQFFLSPGVPPLRSDSESAAVGGLDAVDAALLSGFDYVALGHLHGPQAVGRAEVRYCGSPLKYSFSEARQAKGAVWVELGEKGLVEITRLPIVPVRDMREVRGTLETLLAAPPSEDYLRAILTDEDEQPHAVARLRGGFPNLLRLDYDNARTRSAGEGHWFEVAPQKPVLELFRDFYLLQNGAPLSPEKEALLRELLEQTGGEAP